MPWLRLWIDVLDDVDLHDLSDSCFRGWVLMLAAAKKHNKHGILPELKTMAHWMHVTKERVQTWINELVTAGLLERNDSNGVTISVHGWSRWQEPEDATNAIRQARFRAKKRLTADEDEQNSTPTKSASRACAPAPAELIPETDSETDTPPTPPPLRDRYFPLRNAVTEPLLESVGEGVSECVCVQADSASPQEEKAKPQDDPEVMRIANLAAELTGDVSWSLWVSQRVTLGDPVSWVESAIREMVDAGIIQRKYVGGILKRYAQDGGPKHCCLSNGKPKPKDGPTNMPYGANNPPPDLAKYDTQECRDAMAKIQAQREAREKEQYERAAKRRQGKS